MTPAQKHVAMFHKVIEMTTLAAEIFPELKVTDNVKAEAAM